MLFHTDKLSIVHFATAAHEVNANLGRYSKHGSNIRRQKFNIVFNYPLSETRESATWNQVGAIIAQLYEIDPEMFVGSGSISQGTFHYANTFDFHDKTDGEFRFWRSEVSAVNPLLPSNCTQHKFESTEKETGIWHSLRCKKCGINFYQHGQNTPSPYR